MGLSDQDSVAGCLNPHIFEMGSKTSAGPAHINPLGFLFMAVNYGYEIITRR